MQGLIAAIDQGTTSTRCILFDADGAVASAQKEHRQIYPRPGWLEHDPVEIWRNTTEVVRGALASAGAAGRNMIAVGIANQRESTLVWDRQTGQPLHHAIVWSDTRTRELCDRFAADGGQDRFRTATGLPLATYFSAPKLRWLLDNVPGLRAAAQSGRALFGTIDTWLIWNLTGGTDGGAHVTDVTNASRTMLMDLGSLDWSDELLAGFDIPREMLPAIMSSAEPGGYGLTRRDGPFAAEVRVCGCLGDQQAALVGQTCFNPGESKNTYGTGCFMLLNTGTSPVISRSGLLTTVGYRLDDQPASYALEGSIAVAGSLVQWMRDALGLIDASPQIEKLALTVPDNGGVFFVPAFSGLFAPYWRSDARGTIAGLTAFANKGHLARAVLEATAYQTRDVLDAMRKDSGVSLTSLRVDGGMAANDLLMQFQADVLNVPVVRPRITETTALGAAYAAGLASGYFKDLAHLRTCWREEKRWTPAMPDSTRQRLLEKWARAVERAMGWEK
jgi:glycerol kinase